MENMIIEMKEDTKYEIIKNVMICLSIITIIIVTTNVLFKKFSWFSFIVYVLLNIVCFIFISAIVSDLKYNKANKFMIQYIGSIITIVGVYIFLLAIINVLVHIIFFSVTISYGGYLIIDAGFDIENEKYKKRNRNN